MKLKWYGHSCFGLTFSDGVTVVTDPFDESVGYPLCTARADLALLSHDHFDHNHVQSLSGNPKVLRAPGVHAWGSLRVTALSCFHDPEQGALRGKNLIHIIEGDGLRVAHLGDLGHMPEGALLDSLKGLDLMLIPIGGTFTITAPQAAALIEATSPRVAVAMHFRNRFCQFNIDDEAEFARLTHAARVANELEITPENLATLPAVAIMDIE